MKKTIQKAKVKIIQKAIYEYYCDGCGKKFDKGEYKRTWYVSDGTVEHYHKECDK